MGYSGVWKHRMQHLYFCFPYDLTVFFRGSVRHARAVAYAYILFGRSHYGTLHPYVTLKMICEMGYSISNFLCIPYIPSEEVFVEMSGKFSTTASSCNSLHHYTTPLSYSCLLGLCVPFVSEAMQNPILMVMKL